MTPSVNRERLAATFTSLCEIDSPSRKEGLIAKWLRETFIRLGADSIYEDNSAAQTESESGNLIITFNGDRPEEDGFFLSCHMDTVDPAEGVEVVRTGDLFTSRGDTILGGDDKSGIAAIIELIEILRETNASYPKIQVVITTCEEIGLLGAKHLEFDKITTPYGYALDSSGINQVIVGAPAANKIQVEISGRAAHAGLCPEAGVNALAITASALNSLELGRLDEESTCNFGIIEGGVASNIVPGKIELKGEVRSHSTAKLAMHTAAIKQAFTDAINNWQPNDLNRDKAPSCSMKITSDYPALAIPPGAPVLGRLSRGAALANKRIDLVVAGGGSDANIFCGEGIQTAIIATGMDKVHTVEEQINLADLVELTELLLGMATAETAA